MKTRDPLLEAVGRHIAARDGLADPRWEALVHGELSPEETAALEALATGGEAHPGAPAAFRPLDAAEQDAILAAALAAMESAPPQSSGPPHPEPPAPAPAPAPDASDKPENVIPFRPRRRARWLALAAPLAAAAALVLFLRAGGPGPLPGYGVVVEGGRSEQRATPTTVEAGKPVRLGPEERLRVVLRPSTEVSGPVASQVYFLGPRGMREVKVPIEPGPHGTLLVPELRADMLGEVAGGSGQVLFVVGRPGALPSAAEVASHQPAAAHRFQILRLPVTLGPVP